MWIFVWVVLSSILLGATAWSLRILLRQKAAWEAYAKTKSFTFKRGTFMGPAEMSGVIGDYKLAFFTAERQGDDMRTRRFVTVLEIDLGDGSVDGAVMGSQEMLPFMQTLELIHPYPVEGWDKGYYAFIKNDAVVKAYLTKERLDVFETILKTKNADVLIVFHEKQMVVRLETSDPMQDAEKIDKIVTRQIALMEKLRITAAQREQYKAAGPLDTAPVPVAPPASETPSA